MGYVNVRNQVRAVQNDSFVAAVIGRAAEIRVEVANWRRLEIRPG